ncbi:MAG: exopolysaccharide biosynthesis protein [Aliihoeflea sp.]
MSNQDQPEDLSDVLDQLEDAGDGETVSVGDIVKEIGGDAFGPLLLVPALFLVTPVSGVPGMPSIGSLLISLIAIQIVLGRDTLWLPGFLRRREMKKQRLDKALSWLRKPAGWIDRISSERLIVLTQRPWIMLPASLCALMVLLAPAFETVPFSVSIAAGAVALFALGMVARDGIMVLVALLVFVLTGWLIVTTLT